MPLGAAERVRCSNSGGGVHGFDARAGRTPQDPVVAPPAFGAFRAGAHCARRRRVRTVGAAAASVVGFDGRHEGRVLSLPTMSKWDMGLSRKAVEDWWITDAFAEPNIARVVRAETQDLCGLAVDRHRLHRLGPGGFRTVASPLARDRTTAVGTGRFGAEVSRQAGTARQRGESMVAGARLTG